ncbi:hypothetical protein FQA39_LY02521 [Lamprigera yunnana]|nr:hypothetical protein FQA39_LY02521 [Lamprigera yunnana]
MEVQKKTFRGIEASKMNFWTDAIEVENRLRLKWFRKNEDTLVAYAEKPSSRTVPAEVLKKVADDRQKRYQGVERHGIRLIEEVIPPEIDPSAIYSTMKPIDPDIKKLLYAIGTEKDSRKKYLKERMKTIPEEKYYFTETTSFCYGWNMWHSSTKATPVRYGRSQVIKASFYRRGGVGRDPNWYQKPSTLNAIVCRDN